jgi:hypothetical protein
MFINYFVCISISNYFGSLNNSESNIWKIIKSQMINIVGLNGSGVIRDTIAQFD